MINKTSPKVKINKSITVLVEKSNKPITKCNVYLAPNSAPIHSTKPHLTPTYSDAISVYARNIPHWI